MNHRDFHNLLRNLTNTLTYGLYTSIVMSMLYLYFFIGERLSNEVSSDRTKGGANYE